MLFIISPEIVILMFYADRGHIRSTDDTIDVREALNKNLMVIEVQEMAMYLTDVVVRTMVSCQIKTI
jgi:hypothetical protein